MDGSATLVAVGRGNRRAGAIAGATAGLVATLGIAVDGFNGIAGEAVLCLVWSIQLLALLIAAPPPLSFWKRIAPVIALLVAGFLWSCLPLLLPSLDAATPLAPDLLPAEGAALAGCLAALVTGALLAREPRAASTAIDTLIVLGCATIALGVVLRNTDLAEAIPLWEFRPGDRFSGTLGNPNAMGAYCGALAVLACDRAIGRLPSGRGAELIRAARFFAVGLAVVACGATGSRSAIVATGLVLILLVARRVFAPRRRRGRRPSLMVIGGATALAMLAIFGLSVAFADRYALAGLGSSGRTVMWAHYATLAAGSPWFGYGPASFPMLNQRWLGSPEAAHLMWTVNSPHDVVLQLLLDGGIGQTIAVLAAAALLTGGIVAAVRAEQTGFGIPAALAILVASALVDITLDVPAIAALALFLAGLGWAPAYQRRRISSSSERAIR